MGAALVRGATVADKIGAEGAASGFAGAASALGDASAALDATLAGRATKGAVSGVVGQGALEPLNYEMDQSEHRDWSMNQALANLAFGAVFGGAAGALTRGAAGAGHDAIEAGSHELSGSNDELEAAPPSAERIEALTTNQRGSVISEAVSAMVEDRPSVAHNLVTLNEAQNLRDDVSKWMTEHSRVTEEETALADQRDFSLRQDAVGREHFEANRERMIARIDDLREDHRAVSTELSTLEREMENLRSDNPTAGDTTPDRLAAIESELSASGLTRLRRDRLARERSMILEGGGDQDRIALEAARSAAQVHGLEVRHRALKQQMDRLATRIQAETAKLSGPYKPTDNALSLRIRSQRIDARKLTIHAGLERSLSGYARRVGADATDLDFPGMATQLLNGRETNDILSGILSKVSESPRDRNAFSSSILDAYRSALIDADLTHAEAQSALTDAATRSVLDEAPDVVQARQAVERMTQRAPDLLGAVPDADVAEAERMASEAETQLRALLGDEELTGEDRAIGDVFDQAADDLAGNAKAYESAAACLWRNA